MSNFKLQSFGNFSSFSPHIIDEARFNVNSVSDNTSKKVVRSTGPVYNLRDTETCFYAVKYDTVNNTVVNTLEFPSVRNVVPGPTGLQGEFGFYIRSGTAFPTTLTAITGTSGQFFTNFSTTDTGITELSLSFPNTVLPPASSTPVYLGIKLSNSSFVVNAQTVDDTDQSALDGFCIDDGSNLSTSYPNIDSFNVPLFVPELSVSYV
jgi:hypothetical protein